MQGESAMPQENVGKLTPAGSSDATSGKQYRTQYRKPILRLPKYRHHKASGRGVIRFLPLYGPKDIYLPGEFNSPESRAAYEERCREILAHQLSQQAVPARPIKDHAAIPRMVTAFLAWASGYYGSKTSHFNHFTVLAEMLCSTYPHMQCGNFGPLALKSLRDGMIARGWSRSYVNSQVNRIRRIFSWAVENEWTSPETLAALREVQGLRKGKSTAREKPKVQKVDWADVLPVLPFLSPMVAAMVEVQHLTGMRSDELTRLRVADINRTDEIWIYEPSRHKTAHLDKTKVICLGPRSQELLGPYIAEDREFIFSPAASIAEHNQRRARNRRTKETPSSMKAKQEPKRRRVNPRYTTRGYRQAICYGFEKAVAAGVTITRWHPHQLRHSRATTTRAAYGIEGAQAQLGNTLDATEIYAARSIELAKRIARETG